jgi:glutamyl-tRNA synthetase
MPQSPPNRFFLGRYLPDATNFSKTKKLSWLANTPDSVPSLIVEFDHLISKAKLAEDENFQDFVNPNTRFESEVICDAILR